MVLNFLVFSLKQVKKPIAIIDKFSFLYKTFFYQLLISINITACQGPNLSNSDFNVFYVA